MNYLSDIRFSILNTSHICNQISQIGYHNGAAITNIITPHFNVGEAYPNTNSAIDATGIYRTSLILLIGYSVRLFFCFVQRMTPI